MNDDKRRRIKKRDLAYLLALITIPVVSTIAYVIITTQINVSVMESISISPSSFDLELYPHQSKWVEFVVSNSNPDNDTSVTFGYVITGPSPSELTVDFVPKDTVTVPAGGSDKVRVRIRASGSITPGAYTITITWDR